MFNFTLFGSISNRSTQDQTETPYSMLQKVWYVTMSTFKDIYKHQHNIVVSMLWFANEAH